MNTKILHVLSLLLFFQSASSQTVVSRLTDYRKVIWDDDKEEFIREPLKQDFKSPNPKAIIAFDEITFIDKDTSSIYLNSFVKEEGDSTVNIRIWEEAIHNGLECSVILFFYRQENYYSIRIIYDDYTGIEYYMNPLKVDTIPYKFEKS